MPVRAPEGCSAVYSGSAPNRQTCSLIIDDGNVVPVRRTKDNVPGIAAGAAMAPSRSARSTRSATRSPGDIVVTSGVGGLYRPNIPVAVVARLDGDRAVAIPLANPARIELVAVQRPYKPTAEPAQGSDATRQAEPVPQAAPAP